MGTLLASVLEEDGVTLGPESIECINIVFRDPDIDHAAMIDAGPEAVPQLLEVIDRCTDFAPR